MTEQQKQARQKLLQNCYDYYIWNNDFLSNNFMLNYLYNNGFCKSLAEKTILFIKNNVLKELKRG